MLGRLKVRMLKAVSLDSSKKSCSELNKSVKSVAILISSHHYIVRTPQKIPWTGVEQKRGEGKQRFKKRGGQAGSRGGCLKKVGEGWNPLTNYAYLYIFIFSYILVYWWCILSHLLWRVFHEKQRMLTQWSAPDPMG